MNPEIAHRLNGVRDRIADAASRAGRSPAAIRLVAVSKTFPIDAVRDAATCGQVDFGENKVQEAQSKILSAVTLPLRWHLIGHLQSNKARKAAAVFDVIHSVDTPDLLRRIDDAAADLGRRLDVLIQVDMASEPTKHGAPVSGMAELIAAAIGCTAARLVGLMLLPPAAERAEDSRRYFAALRALRDRLVADGTPPSMLAELSMGMSQDFEIAVEEGATLVRVGSAIFGSRTYP
jgi:pyridoxal phosphate enzyme (YggS family)